ncbi:MAG: hypothetical protein U0176_01890 [Bacteroidia bacterium]
MRMAVLTLLLGCGFYFAHAQEGLSLSGGYYFDHAREDNLDSRMIHKGQVQDGLVWKDEAGENTLIVCYDSDAQRHKRDIYVYQYRVVGGKCTLAWDIKDFGSDLCEMTFVPGSLQLIDLDRDGILEACFMYQNLCDGLDPYVTKMMLMHNGTKLAIRGKFGAEDGEELEKTLDPAIAQAAPIFKNFMLLNWKEFKESGFEYAKSIKYHTSGFIVAEYEYMMASGGTEYRLWDLNGQALDVSEDMGAKLYYSVSLHLMPDRKTLLYASLRGVGTYDPIARRDNSFMSFLKETEALSTVSWNPSKTKIAFTALNHSEYPDQTRIFVLSLDGNSMVRKDKFDAKLLYMAAADWVVEAPRFKDDHTIEYVERVMIDNEFAEGETRQIKVD